MASAVPPWTTNNAGFSSDQDKAIRACNALFLVHWTAKELFL